MPEDVEVAEAEVSDAMSENDHDYDDPDSFRDEDDNMGDHKHHDGDYQKKYDPKNPDRPRRKKARRACWACQRAHLTCSDERPCERCIKRGLQNSCQDGVRKKAKYLHDAPPEALGPVLGPNFSQNAAPSRPNGHRQPSTTGSEASTVNTFFSQPSNPAAFGGFPPGQPPVATLPEAIAFSSQTSPVSPGFQAPNNPPMGSMTVPQVSGDMTNFTPAFFDPSNPALFNFNLEGLNFGSQYGAMEFGMLGHLSSGAADTPPRDTPISQQGPGDINFGTTGAFNGVSQVYDGVGDFLGGNGIYSQGNLQHGLPHAFAIAAGPSSMQSPSTETNSPQPTTFGFDNSPNRNSAYASSTSLHGVESAAARPTPKGPTMLRILPHAVLGKRQRDPSSIYETVTEPYPYVASFHRLFALLQQRLSQQNTYKIAKSLASIRPSFISCTKTLTRQDTVFMEQCFRRTLFEYDDFMLQCSAPTIVCRRSGEVAAVNKEFTALTGWTKGVLLGKESNLNTNTGSADSASGSGSGRAGLATPRLRSLNPDSVQAAEGRPQPIFLTELMDDDSVVEFYEDYSHLAFGDSRGRVTRKCRLLKYRPQDALEPSVGNAADEAPQMDHRQSILSHRVTRIDGAHGIERIARDGKLECSYCWTIKRDPFDIPMMIIVNFLPCYLPNQEPHQLAV